VNGSCEALRTAYGQLIGAVFSWHFNSSFKFTHARTHARARARARAHTHTHTHTHISFICPISSI